MIILINESLLNKWIDFLKRPFTLTYIYINLTSETEAAPVYEHHPVSCLFTDAADSRSVQ